MYKDIFKEKKAAIFDLDETVVDTAYLWHEAFINVVRAVDKYAIGEVLELRLAAGLSVADKWRHVLARNIIPTSTPATELAETTNKEFLKLFKEHGTDVIEGFWSFAALLKLDKNYKLALTTNTPKYVAETVLNELDFGETFDLVIFGDDISKPKPNPEIYEKAVKSLNVKPKEALVFEDSVPGSTASTAAGIDTIVIWNGAISEKDYPIEVLGFVSDFTPFLGNTDKSLEEHLKDYAQQMSQNPEPK